MINYEYEIIRVDPQAKVMEVVYTAEGHCPMHISMRMPYEGELLDSVVRAYAPVAYWQEQLLPIVEVTVGTKGAVTNVPDGSLGAAKTLKRSELADKRFAYETGGIQFRGVRVATDRQSQAGIASACTALTSGWVDTIEWKAEEGQWLSLTAATAQELAEAVTVHVQNSFNLEKQLFEQLISATTIAEVEAVQWPL